MTIGIAEGRAEKKQARKVSLGAETSAAAAPPGVPPPPALLLLLRQGALLLRIGSMERSGVVIGIRGFLGVERGHARGARRVLSRRGAR